jgi:hypothetical protein
MAKFAGTGAVVRAASADDLTKAAAARALRQVAGLAEMYREK